MIKCTVYYNISRDDNDIELTIYGAAYPEVPGVIWDIPERCYPDEPAEAEIYKIVDSNGNIWEESNLTKTEISDIENALIVECVDQSDDYDGPDEDYYHEEF